jgi:hypothetical protein
MFLVTYWSPQFLHVCGERGTVKITNFEEYLSIATRGTSRRFITVQVNCNYYVAISIRLFITNESVMADEYWGTNVKRQPPAARCQKLWRHNVPDGILNKNLKFRQFTYTTALFTVTASDGTDRTQNKMHSAAAFNFSDRQCTLESTVDAVLCWCYWLNGCCS